MRKTFVLPLLSSALVIAAACNPVVATPIVTGGAGGAEARSNGGASNGGGLGGGGSGGGHTTAGATVGSSSGGEVEPAIFTDVGATGITGIVASKDRVYFSTGAPAGLWWVDKSGGAPTPLGVSATYGISIVGDATNLYYAELGGKTASIYEMPLAGGTPTMLVGDYTYASLSLAVDATSVYWAQVSGGGPYAAALMKVPLAGGTPTVVLPALSDETLRFAVNDTTVYWTNDDSQGIESRLLAGGPIVQIDPGSAAPGVYAFGTWMYYQDAHGNLAQVSTGGGSKVFPDKDQAGPMAFDASHVYWADVHAGNIKKMPLGGGPVTTVATFTYPEQTGTPYTGAIAVDDTNVYWGIITTGIIMTAPKGP